MVGRKIKRVKAGPSCSSDNVWASLCQHRQVLLGKCGFEWDSLESKHKELEWKGQNENPLCQNQLKEHSQQQPSSPKKHRAGRQCFGILRAVQPQLSTSIKSTQCRPVHPPREQLETEFHTNNPNQSKYLTILCSSVWLRLLLLFPVSHLCLDGTDSKMGSGHRPLNLYLQYLFGGFSIFKMMDVTGSLLFSSGGGRHLFGICIAWNKSVFFG